MICEAVLMAQCEAVLQGIVVTPRAGSWWTHKSKCEKEIWPYLALCKCMEALARMISPCLAIM